MVVHKDPPYNVTKDFTPIINVAISPYALVVNPSLPVHSLKEFIAYAKANPGKLSYSSPGVGSASHLAAELLKSKAGIEMVHVPNKGMNPALLDLMGGQVQVLFASVPGIAEKPVVCARSPWRRKTFSAHARAADHGRVRLAWICGWQLGRIARSGRPRSRNRQEVSRRNHRHPRNTRHEGRVKTLGYDMIASSPEQFAKELRNDIERWGPVAKRAGDSVK